MEAAACFNFGSEMLFDKQANKIICERKDIIMHESQRRLSTS